MREGEVLDEIESERGWSRVRGAGETEERDESEASLQRAIHQRSLSLVRELGERKVWKKRLGRSLSEERLGMFYAAAHSLVAWGSSGGAIKLGFYAVGSRLLIQLKE